MGTQSEIKDGVYLIKGKHEKEKLVTLLNKFIELFVLCGKCTFPEIYMFVKNNELRYKCNSCGALKRVSEKHNFVNYIKKNQPEKPQKEEVKVETGKKLDKTKIKKIVGLISEVTKKTDDLRERIDSIAEIIKDEADINDRAYFVVLGLFDKHIYHLLALNAPVLRSLLGVKGDDEPSEEVQSAIVTSLLCLIYGKLKSENLNVFIPSILWVLYDQDLVTEEFFLAFCDRGYKEAFNNLYYDQKLKEELVTSGKEFFDWLKTALREGEEERKVEPKKEAEEEEIDIDDL